MYSTSLNAAARLGQVISTARTCNLIMIVLDALKPITHKRLIEYELEGFGIRLNKEPPKISFKKKDRGGVSFSSTVQPTHLDLETVTAILKEYRIHSADIRMQARTPAGPAGGCKARRRLLTACCIKTGGLH